jgi:protein-L-isoaspartate O-methyltransferase
MKNIYDFIGHDYAQTRQPDLRILGRLMELLRLPPGARIADVGAGTGNYSNALADCGYIIKAIEPSQSMRRQAASRPGVCWIAVVGNNVMKQAPLACGELR